MTHTAAASLRLKVRGRVQGVGFRPFVRRLAMAHGLKGWVRNEGASVSIRIEGSKEATSSFLLELISKAPPLSWPEIETIDDASFGHFRDFVIQASSAGRLDSAVVPPDLFVCSDCLEELRDPSERRYRYPFINCTQCGPRYTIIERLPYDRPNTAMAKFSLCMACRTEYENPADRRYHAQPLACATCGPTLALCARKGDEGGFERIAAAREALVEVVVRLRMEAIVAIQGVGGFHLMCDARSEAAVDRLRERKRRPAKPLAVMVGMEGHDGLDRARTIAHLTSEDERALVAPVRPIVLVEKRGVNDMASGIAPGLSEVGVLLPYSPLHALLLEGFGAPLVATSGNRSGDPVETESTSALENLSNVADAFLLHDRPILRPADDPVYRTIAGKARPMRLGRGNAPLQITLPFSVPRPTLAVGGQLKNTVALAWENRAVISPHVGDLDTLRSQAVFRAVASDLQKLYGVRAETVACDLHPDYTSTRWARKSGLPISSVQHHFAHASALVGEHTEQSDVLVFTWDGVGLGEDGSLWGGEALFGRPGLWRRVGTFRPFRLPGGQRAAREPWRSALGLCWESGLTWRALDKDTELLRQAWERGVHAPFTTSVGRLFDGAAALIGLLVKSTYEAQAAMMLEAAATNGPAVELPLLREGDLAVADWAPLLPRLLDGSVTAAERCATFHESLAAVIRDQAIVLKRSTSVTKVGLTGGVFQNRRLTERAVTLLREANFDVLLPERVPGNDAGLSFGQIVEAAAHGIAMRGR